MKIVEQKVMMISPEGEQECWAGVSLIEYAARNCYNSADRMTDEGREAFLKGLLRRGHESPLEFCDVVLEVVTSRDVMAEWTRHRLVSNAIQSQRYVSYKGEVSFISPEFLKDPTQNAKTADLLYKVWVNACEESERAYYNMLDSGARPEDARKALNNSVATRMVTKMNVRELRHLLKLRLAHDAYPEMRHLAGLVLTEVKTLPYVFDDLVSDHEARRMNELARSLSFRQKGNF